MNDYQTVSLAAKRLGIPAPTLRRWCADGRIAGVVIVESEKQVIYGIPKTLTVDGLPDLKVGRPRAVSKYDAL